MNYIFKLAVSTNVELRNRRLVQSNMWQCKKGQRIADFTLRRETISQGMQGSLKAKKGKEIGYLLELPEKDAALPTS